jgi:hypothetical protein
MWFAYIHCWATDVLPMGPPRDYISSPVVNQKLIISIACGGGVEYLHHNPASRRRRRKGKTRIWYSKLWSRVRPDSDPRMIALARARSNFKRHTRPLVRERAPHQQACNCLTAIKICSYVPDGCFIPSQTDQLTVGRNIRLRSQW